MNINMAKVKKLWLLLIVALLHQSILHCYCYRDSRRWRPQVYFKRAVPNGGGGGDWQRDQSSRQRQDRGQGVKAVSAFHGAVYLNRSEDGTTKCGQRLLYAVKKACEALLLNQTQGQRTSTGSGAVPQKRAPFPFPFPQPLTPQDQERQRSITDECCKKNTRQGCSNSQLFKYCGKKRPERTVTNRELEETGTSLAPAPPDSEDSVIYNIFMRPRLVQLLDWFLPPPTVAPRVQLRNDTVANTNSNSNSHTTMQAQALHAKNVEDQLHAEVQAIYREYNAEPPVYLPLTTARPSYFPPGGYRYPRTFAPNALDSDESEHDRRTYRETWEQTEYARWNAERSSYNNARTTTSRPPPAPPANSVRDYGPVNLPYGRVPTPSRPYNTYPYVPIIDNSDAVLGQ